MTDHLPECPESDEDWIANWWDGIPCICERLRACEQRVRMEDDDYAYVAAQAEADGRRRGWVEALDAAWEAVEALGPLVDVDKWSGGYDCCGCNTTYLLHNDALAAINALREEQK